jgi:hypothetical protein
VSSPCFEFGVALRTGHDLPKSVKRQTRKAWSLQVRRTTPFEIDRSNDLFSEPHAKLLFHPDARVAKALLASLGPKSSSLQSVRCAAYPHEIVHDDGRTKGVPERWVVSFGGQSARAVLLGRQFPVSKTDTRGRSPFAESDSGGEEDKSRMVSASNVGTKKWPPQRRRPLRFSVVRLLTPSRAFLGLQYIATVRSASSSRYRSSEYPRQKAYPLHRSLYS